MLEKEPAIELCGNLVTHQDRVTVKPVARPPYFKAFKEPAFATRTMRISDSRAGQVNKPAGNPAQAWNSDESRLLLHRYGNQHELILHDGRTYQELGGLDISPVNPEDVFWSMRNPDLIYARVLPLPGVNSQDHHKTMIYSVFAVHQAVVSR